MNSSVYVLLKELHTSFVHILERGQLFQFSWADESNNRSILVSKVKYHKKIHPVYFLHKVA